MMLSKSVFCMLSGVKITLKNPKMSLEIFNFKAFGPNCCEAHKKQCEFDPWILEKNYK